MLKMDRIIECQPVYQRRFAPLKIGYFKTLNLGLIAEFDWLMAK
jgi:hypothetical protein